MRQMVRSAVDLRARTGALAAHLVGWRPAVALLVAVATLAAPRSAAAQYAIGAESGDTVSFESESLRVMLDTARALWNDLETDPNVLYYTPGASLAPRRPVDESDPGDAYPWNAITVLSDSTIDVLNLPANLREADRAYYNYAVQRMRVVRGADPDVPCDSVLALEERVVGSFIDGWILSRTLYGGPSFAPLDELVFARRDGLLRPLLASKRDPQVGACAGQWAEANPERMQAYEAWRKDRFPMPVESEEETEAPPDSAATEPVPADSSAADSTRTPQGDEPPDAPAAQMETSPRR
jgi:hypothetical protein